MCDAACQHVMTKHRSAFRSTQPCCAPLNLSLPTHSFPPFPLFPFCLSFTSQNFLPFSPFLPPPPPPPVKLLFFCAALTHSSSTLKRGRRGKQKGRGWRGEERKGGKVSEKVRDESAGHFLSHCCGERNRESESAKRELGDQRQTDSDRDGEVEKQRKKEGNRYVKRDSSVFGEVRSISLLLRCQHYFSHPHFLMFSSSYYPPVYCSLLLFRHLHLSVFSLIPRAFLVTDSTNCQCRGS